MLFPFITNLKRKRNVTSAPNGWYKPVRSTSDSNLVNAFEATTGPPPLDLTPHGFQVATSPGPEGAFFLPFIETGNTPFPQQAGILTRNQYGGGMLFDSPESNPESEIF